MASLFMMMVFTTTLFVLTLCVSADDRTHGLDNEIQNALPPEAYAFFHPDPIQSNTNNPCDSPDCSSSLPLAAMVQSTPAHESERGLGVEGIAGIPLGFVFACFLAMGIYYVVIKRHSNMKKANPDHGEENTSEVK